MSVPTCLLATDFASPLLSWDRSRYRSSGAKNATGSSVWKRDMAQCREKACSDGGEEAKSQEFQNEKPKKKGGGGKPSHFL